MADLAHLKKYFSSMSDEKLQHTAVHEKNTLTKEALHILMNIYRARGFDLAVFEPTQAELLYDKERHWFFALAEKRSGKTEEELFSLLIERGLTEAETHAVIQRLPQLNVEDEAFETYIKQQCEHEFLSGTFLRILLIGVGICAIGYGAVKFVVPSTVAGIIFLAVGIFVKTATSKGGDFWIDRIKNNPESIVWIVPVVEKHTLWYIVTLFKVNKFQMHTRDSIGMTFTCEDDATRNIFLNGIKTYIPHAHIGAHMDASELYEKNPDDLINALQHINEYLSVSVGATLAVARPAI